MEDIKFESDDGGTFVPKDTRPGHGPQPGELSNEQRVALGVLYQQHLKAARKAAYAIVRDSDLTSDVVQTAITRLIAAITRPLEPEPFPADGDAFRARWIAIVKNLAKDCVKKVRPTGAVPVHAFWGETSQCIQAGKKVPERPLSSDFAPAKEYRNRAEDEEVSGQPAKTGRGLHYWPRRDWKVMLDRLESIVWREISDLCESQRTTLQMMWAAGWSRAKIAKAMGISVHTVDSNRERAYENLRKALTKKRYFVPDSIDEEWHAIFVAMRLRAKARRLDARRAAADAAAKPADDRGTSIA